MSLTANQPLAAMDAKKFKWQTKPSNEGVQAQFEACRRERVPERGDTVEVHNAGSRGF